ncbi:nitrate reductase molybdenum cofactor assembly chaperone [Nonomuraea sp. SMC257]|uniref:Nitrate reductase molybdenum cofactor assembly chaperone n=2 Tax=Nonomuraea montanisoli TaxID=2741721 RepID=A0A7Y6M283_9ACTN|nr:nitrate reductase molybdenum cofactor assembly chaperone [Nonomuraea montanisoli]
MTASVLLGHPDERLVEALPLLTMTVDRLPAGEAASRLRAFLKHLATTPLPRLAEHYVATFDLKCRCSPYLTYSTYGDARKRGMALLRFKHAFREAGFEPTGGELPDHLAVVCELSARGGVAQAARLLREHRAGVETLHRALREERSPYADVVAAVLATLPPPGAREPAAARRPAREGPPEEQVGVGPTAHASGTSSPGVPAAPRPGWE